MHAFGHYLIVESHDKLGRHINKPPDPRVQPENSSRNGSELVSKNYVTKKMRGFGGFCNAFTSHR